MSCMAPNSLKIFKISAIYGHLFRSVIKNGFKRMKECRLYRNINKELYQLTETLSLVDFQQIPQLKWM